MLGKLESEYTKFSFLSVPGTAADFGNFHAGYTGSFTYGGAGIPRILQWTGAGAFEILKNYDDGEIFTAFLRLHMLVLGLPPRDQLDDYLWNTSGMNHADNEKNK